MRGVGILGQGSSTHSIKSCSQPCDHTRILDWRIKRVYLTMRVYYLEWLSHIDKFCLVAQPGRVETVGKLLSLILQSNFFVLLFFFFIKWNQSIPIRLAFVEPCLSWALQLSRQ